VTPPRLSTAARTETLEGWESSLTGRFLAGAATRITSGVVLTAGAGVLTRYEWGRPTGGVPTIGMFGVASNLELDIRLLPAISMGFFVEGAIAPFPYLAQTNLGDLFIVMELLQGATLAQMFERTGVDLSLVVTDTTDEEMLVLNQRTAPGVPVEWAVRMSMSIPFVWREVVWREEWGTYLFFLREHADADGTLPSSFDQLINDIFGPLPSRDGV